MGPRVSRPLWGISRITVFVCSVFGLVNIGDLSDDLLAFFVEIAECFLESSCMLIWSACGLVIFDVLSVFRGKIANCFFESVVGLLFSVFGLINSGVLSIFLVKIVEVFVASSVIFLLFPV